MSIPAELGLIDIILIAILVVAVYYDITEYRIPNQVTVGGILFGLILGVMTGGIQGLYSSLLGGTVGFSLLFIPFLLRGIGAGDVKLLTAIGAIKGMEFVLYTAGAMAIVGGLMALYYLLILKQRKMFFPYGIAIVVGDIISFGLV